jgi:hypothetical protein
MMSQGEVEGDSRVGPVKTANHGTIAALQAVRIATGLAWA